MFNLNIMAKSPGWTYPLWFHQVPFPKPDHCHIWWLWVPQVNESTANRFDRVTPKLMRDWKSWSLFDQSRAPIIVPGDDNWLCSSLFWSSTCTGLLSAFPMFGSSFFYVQSCSNNSIISPCILAVNQNGLNFLSKETHVGVVRISPMYVWWRSDPCRCSENQTHLGVVRVSPGAFPLLMECVYLTLCDVFGVGLELGFTPTMGLGSRSSHYHHWYYMILWSGPRKGILSAVHSFFWESLLLHWITVTGS